jgi:hypothetical protein
MAKKRKRKYSRASGTEVKREMHRYKRGKAKSGKGGKAGKVKSRKQAIAIALSKARKKGKRVPSRTFRPLYRSVNRGSQLPRGARCSLKTPSRMDQEKSHGCYCR